MANSENGVCFVWKIENFSMLPHQVGEMLDSPKFVIDKWENVFWCLRLYPKGAPGDVKGNISLFLLKKSIRDLEVKVNYSLTLESTKLSREISNSKTIVFRDSGKGYIPFVSINKLYAHKSLYLPQDTLTIRCKVVILDDKKSFELSVNEESKFLSKLLMKYCVSRTCIAVHRRILMWPIHNIKKLVEQQSKNCYILASPLKHSPSLKLTIFFNENSNEIPIWIEQTCLSKNYVRLFVKCMITVISANGKYQDFNESSHLFELNVDDVWHFPSFIKTSMLTNDKYLYVDDTLFLRCEFAFSYKVRKYDSFHLENTYRHLAIETRRDIQMNELSKCLTNIHENAKFCDIELNAGGKTFPYYKAILCARSAVFSAMFENDMKEKNTNVVDIPDVDSDTLKKMLEYMLSDVVEEDFPPENACKLYKAADKYAIESLKRKCSILLSAALSVANVCDLLTLADLHQDDFLMIAVHDFIGNRTDEIFHSAQWKDFVDENPKLAANIMQKMWMGKFHL